MFLAFRVLRVSTKKYDPEQNRIEATSINLWFKTFHEGIRKKAKNEGNSKFSTVPMDLGITSNKMIS